jgi:tRNA(Ile2) C34 agmatinyltransferase TiaS
MIFIGIDDTDSLESRGTGHLARQIAAQLVRDFDVLGVTRHQLLVDPRVPCTKNNSCAAITLDTSSDFGLQELEDLIERIQALMQMDYVPGSDPGLCIAQTVPPALSEFGRRAQRRLVSQTEARAIAAEHKVYLAGLGGDEDGIIGALAAVGLVATGEDGRYVLVGRSRELSGLQPISALLAAGIAKVQNLEGQTVTDGLVQTDKLRPARRGNQPIAVVQWNGNCWLPLKLD